MRPRLRRAFAPFIALVCLSAFTYSGADAAGGLLSGTLSQTGKLLNRTVNAVLDAPAMLLSTVGKVTVTLLGGAPPNGDTRTSVMVPVNGATGGVARVGRFTVRVPEGAWDGLATVTIRVPDPNVAQCDLEISGVANSFSRPVTLEIDTRGTNATDPGMVWFDPGTGKWYLLAGESSADRVTSSLRHFSKYGAVGGKAGW